MTEATKSEDWQENCDKSSILKSRDITLPTKVGIVKALVFPVVTYGCESWTMKKAGRQRMNWLDGITNAMDTNLGKLWEMVRDRQSWCAVVHRVTESVMTGQLRNDKNNNNK